MRVGGEGLIEADEDPCRAADFDPDRVTRTVEVLNLNATRLRLAREKCRNDLVEWSRHIDDADTMKAWVRSVLTSDTDDRLPRFFTTSRFYFARVSERILNERPQTWN